MGMVSKEVAATVGFFLLMTSVAPGQQGAAGGAVTTAPRRLSRTSTTTPSIPQQPVFYAGKVLLDTGTAPPSPVAVLRVCNGLRRREAFTVADGSFSFMVGDKASEVLQDASDDSHGLSSESQFSRGTIPVNGQFSTQSQVSDCELRAELAGYTSSSIRLDPSMNNSTIGIIMLHSRAKKADGMVTVASLEVPAKARKEYEKGSEQLEKGNLAEAEKSLRKAIEEYPKFAEAWARTGDLEQRRRNMDGAIKDYQEAIADDPNLPMPYFRLAFLEATSHDWEQTLKLTDKLISLAPTDFPLAYYFNGIAELNLNHIDKAETSALRAQALDKQHMEPRVELLLANIYTAKGSLPLAADHYRAYLKLVPDGPLTERVKTDLAKIEEMAKTQTPPVPQPNK
jgi:tetratricopeptide (TPR) repeat protein